MQHALWIIARQQESITALCRELADLRLEATRPFGWCVSAGLTKDEKPPLPLSKLSGAVIIVDREALLSEMFAEVARLPIATMTDRDDFCVFPWLCGVTMVELNELALQGNPLAISLVDNIHLDLTMESLPGLMKIIRCYLDKVEMLRSLSFFERLSIGIGRVFGKVAAGLSYIVVLMALAMSVVLWMRIPIGIPLTQGVVREASAIVILAAVSIIGLRFQRLFGLLRGSPELQHNYPGFAVEFYAIGGAGLVLSLAGASLSMGSGLGTLVAGFGLGFMLVSLEHTGQRARIRRIPFASLPQAIVQETILPRLYDTMTETMVSTGIPFFEAVHKRVFISYSRSSAWSSESASQIAAALQSLGAYVFLDRPSLRPGLPWKRQIRWAIDSSNVFVVVLDEVASRREWIAAEFVAAYYNKIVKGTPEIFIVHPKEIDFTKLNSPAGLFFAELIVRPSRAIPERMRSRMTAYNTQICAEICSAIWSYPIAGSFGVTANLIISLIVALLVPVVGFACYLGLPLMLIHLLAIQDKIASPLALLAAHSEMAVPVAAVTLAFTGGFSLRCALRSFADIRRSDYSYTPGYLELIETAAFFVGLCLCAPWLSLKEVCLVILSVFFGLELGNYFTLCMRTWKGVSV